MMLGAARNRKLVVRRGEERCSARLMEDLEVSN